MEVIVATRKFVSVMENDSGKFGNLSVEIISDSKYQELLKYLPEPKFVFVIRKEFIRSQDMYLYSESNSNISFFSL